MMQGIKDTCDDYLVSVMSEFNSSLVVQDLGTSQ